MSTTTQIQWTDATWNIARGCTKVDEDCKFCYMYRDSLDSTRYNPLEIVRTKTVFDMPLRYKGTISACWPGNPLIFTCSLTDFFHPAIDGYRHEAWDIIRTCPHLTFQILTKRPERISSCLPPDWGEGWSNVWLGTSVGSGTDKGYQRMSDLVKIPAITRFLSIEPLHAPVDLSVLFIHNISKKYCEDCGDPALDPCDNSHCRFKKINWVIVGGESGNENGKYKYRPCELSWIESIVSQCQAAHVPVFVKQMGTHISKQLGLKDRHGGDINEFPAHLRIRQFPAIK